MERSYVEYKDKRYPTIIISANAIVPGYFENAPDDYEVTIADVELWSAIEKDYEKNIREALDIDNEIFYYCDSGFIASKPTEGEVVHYFKNVNL